MSSDALPVKDVSRRQRIGERQEQMCTYPQPYCLIELGQVSRGELMLTLHGHMAVDLRPSWRAMMEMHTRGRRGLLVMIRHGR